MPLISKPNYNQVFASQAPDIDNPAVFNNYPEGWGPESRPNNGKPTIKGFNYLQQTSDLKDLWILQNGACLPYDESIEYAEGAPVLKDGVIQYKTAGGFKSRDAVTIPTYSNAADGVDPVTGVTDGAYFNVRSTDDDTMLVEYQNVGGVPTPTGISYPSSSALNNLQHNNLKDRNEPNAHTTSAITDAIFNANQELLNQNRITVVNFGAKGDNATDDSDAFQAYVDSSLTGQNVYLGAKGRYRITKQINLKGKGLVGGGAGRIHESYYNWSSINVDGRSTELAGKSAFINCGPTIQNLTAICTNGHGNQVSFVEIDGFSSNITNITVVNFYNQIVVKNALVGFNIINAWLYYSQNAGLYCEDPANQTSTTGSFTNMYFHLGDGYAMIFNKDIYGCAFDNIIYEFMNGGIRARTVAECSFGKFWCEGLKTETSKDWLEVTGTANNCYGNVFVGTPKLLGGWTSKASPVQVPNPSGNNYAGASITGDGIAVSGPGSNFKMLMTQSGFSTGSGEIRERHISPTATSPITKRRVIGADADGAPYLASDTYTKLSRKWGTYNHETGNSGAFHAPMMLTYDVAFSTPQNNNGWTITREGVGVFRVVRVTGSTAFLNNPHIVVGAALMGGGPGTGEVVAHGIQMMDTFEGSWNAYDQAAGFKVFWRNLSGALVDPIRFTVAFTATS